MKCGNFYRAVLKVSMQLVFEDRINFRNECHTKGIAICNDCLNGFECYCEKQKDMKLSKISYPNLNY
jgi:hypothetical protein